ncbi:hypothetical protein EVAR_37384_1 [Eumeta japonica]|uniref:Uncharacterized protein n=1 Tax=Eumeta variegata TaxID=151549 RepID=A0A4C1ZT30_EUMVA|nr:hypothetical protein EVAR_37384_1 [Eumeta japonica]
MQHEVSFYLMKNLNKFALSEGKHYDVTRVSEKFERTLSLKHEILEQYCANVDKHGLILALEPSESRWPPPPIDSGDPKGGGALSRSPVRRWHLGREQEIQWKGDRHDRGRVGSYLRYSEVGYSIALPQLNLFRQQ